MYALHEAGSAVTGLPPPQPAARPTDQLEQRAVEATEHGSLTTEDRHNIMYSSAAAVLQLLESSTQQYAEMLAVVNSADAEPTSLNMDADGGEQVDVYA